MGCIAQLVKLQYGKPEVTGSNPTSVISLFTPVKFYKKKQHTFDLVLELLLAAKSSKKDVSSSLGFDGLETVLAVPVKSSL